MSTPELTQAENDNKSSDKLQIEAEEKEFMLKSIKETSEEESDAKSDEGPVKAALSGDITEQGREVKPKFIPIGAIKMPGFFTRKEDREKSKDEESIVKEVDEKNQEKSDEEAKSKHGLGFLRNFTQLFHKNSNEADAGSKKSFGIFKVKYPKMFQKSSSTAEAALASMETLEDKIDTTNDGMENVKLDMTDEHDGKVATRLPLRERIRQKKFATDDIAVIGVALLIVLAVIIGVVVGAQAGPPTERPLRLGRFVTTQTSCGLVEGILEDGVYKFYSIPYAVPPIEEKRFTYAQPLNDIALCWNGTKQVHSPGSLCLQTLENGTILGDEDCLTLDVITPHVRYDTPLPVVVLVGANTLAGGIGPCQPSASYARTKEVVFVRPNFRLGTFGFLALDILSNSKYPPTSGNYALSDLYVALQWVNINIQHFGGDRNSITVLAHRAGATLTAALTTMKKAQKLYSRVWLSSASVIFPGEPLEQSQKNNEQFKQISKCSDVDCLRHIPAEEILASTPDTWLGSDIDSLPISEEPKRSWLVLDGNYLTTHAYESWEALKESKTTGKLKPIVFGTTEHSGNSNFLYKKHLTWSPAVIEKMVNDSYLGKKNLSIEVFKHFNKTYEGLVELISSIRILCPLVSLARLRLVAPMYIVLGSGAGGGKMGSGMAGIDSDMEAILGTFNSETPEQRRYMSAMQQQFYYYVWHGRLPNHEGLISIGQDTAPHRGLPACDFLIQEDIVPRYAHVD